MKLAATAATIAASSAVVHPEMLTIIAVATWKSPKPPPNRHQN